MDSPTLNMVQNQIAPSGVTHDGVLEAFLAHDRAGSLPPDLRARAYADDDIVDDEGNGVMLRPLTLALMLQHLARDPSRGQVAVIGDATGYASSLLHDLGFAAIDVTEESALHVGGKWQGILLYGAVSALPANLFAYLEPQGVMLAVLQKQGSAIGDIVAASHPSSAHLILGQAHAPRLQALEPQKEFAL